MLPVLLLLVLLLHYREVKRCPSFRRWCRRYAADFTAVGAAITVQVGSMLPQFSPLVQALCSRFYRCWCCYYTTGRVYAAQIFPVGVGVMLPILLQLVLLVHYA